jgi:arsenite-transporting ATPase
LVFVGGKGGVGKTTVAAALALRLAAKRPAQSILLLSTDPAHSLTDVFGAAITNVAAPIRSAPQNLFGRELNAQQAFRDQRRALEAAMADVGRAPNESLLRGANAEGRLNALVGRLLDLTPPGIDELFAMLSVVDARSRYDVVVVDSAPTGHALRLLAMPDAARAWVQALLRMLLKYRDVVKPGPLAADLVHASRSIRELQAALRDRKKTRFIVVTRAARVPRAETERLMARLHALAIAPVAIVVNARTFDPGRCRRCRSTARAERRELAALRPPRDCVIIQTPLVVPPPRGAVQLNRWAKNWTTSDS